MESRPDPRLDGLPRFDGSAVILAASDWTGVDATFGTDAPRASVPDWGAAAAAVLPGFERLDLVVLAGVLRLVASPTALLDAAIARLRPGGVLLIAEPLRLPDAEPLDRRHVDALDLGAAIAHARGWGIAPVYKRLQVGSVIQGYGLLDLHFDFLPPGGEAKEARADWRERLDAAAGDTALPAELRGSAAQMAQLLASEPFPLSATHRVWGRVPG